jgi:hypothetical protein
MDNLDWATSRPTLGDLPLHDFQVNLHTSGLVVAQQFEQRPDLPGVVIMSDTKLVGVISRRRFHEQMSKPTQQLLLEKPIQGMLEIELKRHRGRSLVLLDTEPIDLSARTALNRPATDAYEPIVVMFQDQSLPTMQAYFLLDVYTLLQAQAQILMAMNQEMRHQQAALEEQQRQVQVGQQKVADYTRLLEAHQQVIQERNLLLETQQMEILEQARDIAQFNRRFLRIGQLLSAEGQQIFQSTFAGVNAICHNTTQIVGIGRSLSEDLTIIQETSQLIAKVSQQVRHLSVQAAIVANHVGVEMAGFSHITAEIGKLVNQTLDAGRQMDRLASRFRNRVQALTESAESGTTVAQGLLKKIEQAQMALAELEMLVQGPMDPTATAEAGHPRSPNVQEAAQALIQKIATAEATIADLEQLLHRRDLEPLLHKIKRTLDKNRNTLSPPGNSP